MMGHFLVQDLRRLRTVPPDAANGSNSSIKSMSRVPLGFSPFPPFWRRSWTRSSDLLHNEVLSFNRKLLQQYV